MIILLVLWHYWNDLESVVFSVLANLIASGKRRAGAALAALTSPGRALRMLWKSSRRDKLKKVSISCCSAFRLFDVFLWRAVKGQRPAAAFCLFNSIQFNSIQLYGFDVAGIKQFNLDTCSMSYKSR